jgi:phosphoenolpyruvate synthase/pyruvate phosphate dikinase
LVKYCTVKELINGINITMLPELQKRKEFCLVYQDKFGERIFRGKEAREIYSQIARDKDKYTQVINGVCASIGKTIGNVIICSSLKDIANFKEGHILVTSMTRPEFMPAMKKAIAIVTDEGGITCHAAIISRELGIPCVIGTKNATKLLKNGNLVEVNANHGVVKILK